VGVPACTAHISLRCFRRRLSYPRPLRWAVATPHRMLAEHPLHAAQAESELGSEVAPSRFCLGAYLAKRSELVADLADQVQDHACQHRRSPVWLRGEFTRASHLSAKSQFGGPPGIGPQDLRATGGTQLETHFQPCGNNVSTGTSPIPPIRQPARGPTSDGQDTPPLAGSARTKEPNGVGAGRPRPADSAHTAVVRSRRSNRGTCHGGAEWTRVIARSSLSWSTRAPVHPGALCDGVGRCSRRRRGPLRRQMRPVSWAHMATSTRFRAPSFRMRLARWALTVLGVM
jgi:hypothetical protein